MSVVEKGKNVDLLLMVLLCGIIYFCIYRSSKGKVPSFRALPGLEGIKEAVLRAVEMRRPVLMTTGMGGFDREGLAGLAVTSHVAKLCAEYEAKLIVPVNKSEVLPLVESIVQKGYEEAAKPELYKPGQQVQWLSGDQFGYAAGVLGIIERERTAAQILVGYFLAEVLLYLEAGKRVGAFQVGGTAQITNIPFFFVSCDYCLITEEIFAAGAYLSGEPHQLGSIAGQDIVRITLVALMVVGFLAAALGSKIIYDWLGV